MPNEVLKYEATVAVGAFTVQNKATTQLADYVLASLEIEPGSKPAIEKFEVATNRKLVALIIREKNFGKTPREITFQFQGKTPLTFALVNGSETLLANAVAGFGVVDNGAGLVRISNSSKEKDASSAELDVQKKALDVALADVKNAKPEELKKVQEALAKAQKTYDQAKSRSDAAKEPAIVEIMLGYCAINDEASSVAKTVKKEEPKKNDKEQKDEEHSA